MSSLYQTLEATARECVLSTSPVTIASGGLGLDHARIWAIRTPTFLQYLGPEVFTASPLFRGPSLRGPLDTKGYIEKRAAILPNFEMEGIEVAHVIVDETKKEVVLRCNYISTPKGPGTMEERTVFHDILWFMKMTEDGKLVEKATVFADSAATMAIMDKLRIGEEAVFIAP